MCRWNKQHQKRIVTKKPLAKILSSLRVNFKWTVNLLRTENVFLKAWNEIKRYKLSLLSIGSKKKRRKKLLAQQKRRKQKIKNWFLSKKSWWNGQPLECVQQHCWKLPKNYFLFLCMCFAWKTFLCVLQLQAGCLCLHWLGKWTNYWSYSRQ